VRRRHLVVALILTLGSLGVASAQIKYPKGVVSLVTHSSPGGGSDVFLREMVPHLTRIMRVTFVVENQQGGSGAKAMAMLAKARPDGGMFYATTPTFIYTSLLSKPAASYADLEPLVNIFYDPEVVYTAADSRFKTLKDVVDRARQGGGRWGAANPASLERQALERVKQKAGVTPAIATFEGGGALLINVLNHTLDMGIGELQEIRTQLEVGKIRLLGVVGDQRLPQFPDVKTVREQGIDVSVRKFRGLAGPKGTSREVIAAWEAAIPKLLEDSRYKQLYIQNGLQPGFMPHAEYRKFMDGFARETIAFLRESGVIR
jgi:putative tricarboxylic transport membrane protein